LVFGGLLGEGFGGGWGGVGGGGWVGLGGSLLPEEPPLALGESEGSIAGRTLWISERALLKKREGGKKSRSRILQPRFYAPIPQPKGFEPIGEVARRGGPEKREYRTERCGEGGSLKEPEGADRLCGRRGINPEGQPMGSLVEK